MADEEVEVAVIGAGSAGLAAFRAARAYTESVVLIEGGPYGTTCARVGCMPSKLLIAAADAAHAVGDAGRFGVEVPPPDIDGRAVMARLHRYRDRFVDGVVDAIEAIPAEMRLRGYARFSGENRLKVGDRTIVASRIVIATGSKPVIVDDLRGAGSRVITSADLFEMDDLPASIAVFGAGVIGLELAQALHRLRVRVRLFGVGGLVGPLTDPDVVEAATAILRGEYPFDPDADVRSVEERDGGVEIKFVQDGHEKEDRFDYVLAATGRKPQLDRLALERAGLDLADGGVPVVDRATGQCGTSSVFIAGDADGELPLLHAAADAGRLAGDNAGRYPDVRVGLRRTPLTIVFTRPEIALIGRTFRELRDAGTRFEIGTVDFAEQGRALVSGRAAGILRIYGEAETGRLLGAELAAPDGEHLAHLLAVAMQSGLNVVDALQLPFYHPTLEEGLRTALRDLACRLRMGPEPVAGMLDCGPGG